MPFLPQRVSLKLKMFGGAMAVVLLVSAVIALLARWILVTSLNRELEQRGVAKEAVSAKMAADVSQGKPATEAVKAQQLQSAKARPNRSRSSKVQRTEIGR